MSGCDAELLRRVEALETTVAQLLELVGQEPEQLSLEEQRRMKLAARAAAREE